MRAGVTYGHSWGNRRAAPLMLGHHPQRGLEMKTVKKTVRRGKAKPKGVVAKPLKGSGWYRAAAAKIAIKSASKTAEEVDEPK
jgi:hypothetical protein